MRAQVEGLEAVLPDGNIYNGLAALKKDNRGYDLRHMLIGAEGTIGVITAASLRLVPAIAARVVTWAGIDSPQQALALLRHMDSALGDAVEGFEVVADDLLSTARSRPSRCCDIWTRHWAMRSRGSKSWLTTCSMSS